MKFSINGQTYTLTSTSDTSVTTALTLHFNKPQQSTFAVALNGDFIGKADYGHTMVKNGDRLDVLQPIQGG